ncbi:MAG: tRNA epoxyqueuosine(34) reductase QueG [Gemmatimonadetes bacterium]|nr:tRNA epoxyqueuosine(34) reductase QueG [Gemmatimonadota bacterium]
MLASTASLTARLKKQAKRLGFDLAGIAPLHQSDHAAFLQQWLAAGRNGQMAYLARPDAVARRLDPRRAWPELRSALVVGLNYYPDDRAAQGEEPERQRGDTETRAGDAASYGIVARYSRGRDYHKVLKQKLLALLAWLEGEVGRELPAARAYVDTGPVLERELARRAGLGWFGRNTMLIHPRRGSYFFLGTLLLELELEPDAPFEADHCGRCNACVEACPTGALLGRDAAGAPVIDARRCISYLTIELRGPIPRELRPLVGDRIFGCDICQEACPFNGPKFVKLTREPELRASSGSETDRDRGRDRGRRVPTVGTGSGTVAGTGQGRFQVPGTDGPRLVELMAMSQAEWEDYSRGSAFRRAKRAGFLRNVAVALGNWGSPEAVPVLVKALQDEEPLVRGHAVWALGRIRSPGALRALQQLRSVERDGLVLEELQSALEVGHG